MMSTDKQEGMTASEAVEAMRQGKKLTHYYFQSYEWVTMKEDRIVMEDGASIDFDTFWSDRDGVGRWHTGWQIFEENQTK